MKADETHTPRRLHQKDLKELRKEHQSGEDKLIPIWQKAVPKELQISFMGTFSRTTLATFSPI